MERQRFGCRDEDRFAVFALHELGEQVLLQERVRPVVSAGTARKDDFRVLQADDCVVRGQTERQQQAVQDVTPDVAAERRHRVRRELMMLGHGLDPAVPKLGGRLRPDREHVGRDVIDAALDAHVSGERPGVELLQREQRIPAAPARGFLNR